MEPERSLPHSQVPATCPYPEPARFSPYPTSHFLKIHLNIIPPIYVCVSQVVSFPQVSPPEPVYASLLPLYALHAPLISFGSILSPEQYWARRTDH